MADDLKVTLGVELDPTGLAQIKAELDSLKNGKGNIIDVKFNSKITSEIAKLNTTLSTLNKDISTISSNQISIQVDASALSNLQNMLTNINQMLANINNQSINPNIANGNNGSNNGGRGGNRHSDTWVNGNNPAAVTQMGDYRRYQQELDRMADTYAIVFGGTGGRLDSRTFNYDAINDSATAVLRFNDAIGSTHSLMVKLENVSKENTDWNVVSQSFSENLNKQSIEIDRSLDKISQAQIKLDKLRTSATTGAKPLSDRYADVFNQEADNFQNRINNLQNLVNGPNGIPLDAAQIRDLNAAYAQLENTFKTQRNLQWTGSKLNSNDITSQISEYNAKINELKNNLSDKGIGETFKAQITDLNNQLNNEVQNGTMGITEWKSKFQELKASIQEFQSTPAGKGQMLAFEIDTNQIQKLEQLSTVMNNIPQNLQGSGTEALKQNIDDLATKYQDLMTKLQSGNLDGGTFDNLKRQVEDLDRQFKDVTNSAQKYQEGLANDKFTESFNLKAEGLKQRFEQLKQRYDDFITANPSKGSLTIDDHLDSVAEKLKNIDPENADQIARAVANVSREVNNVISGGQSLAQIMQQNFGGLGQYLSRFVSTTYLLTKGIQTVKSMIGEVRSLDTSLMELGKVTDLSGESMTQFTDKAYDVGKTVGRTGKDVVDAVTTFSRAGYTLDESMDLAKSALVMSNVGVDIPNMESAASDMISIMKAYDIQAEDSMLLIDKLYNVANKEPLDFGNITSMLVTAGGTLAQTNTSLEETMGLLTGGFATLRDNSVANG